MMYPLTASKSRLSASKDGFTLIELSIVLVILGLIVGGVLVGQDLIRSAAVRTTVTEVEKYNQAVNTFRGKYNALPGDIAAVDAARFGFTARGTLPGEGDGNHNIEGTNGGGDIGLYQGIGEVGLFWRDLSTARLINGTFTTAQATGVMGPTSGTALDDYLPKAKIGRGNYFYVYNAGIASAGVDAGLGTGVNYFGIAVVRSLGSPSSGHILSTIGLTVREAHSIDSKMDDGKPQYGNVTATGESGANIRWGDGDMSSGGLPHQGATPASSLTCYDNNNQGGEVQNYSLTQNNGNGVNCWLSFRFQ